MGFSREIVGVVREKEEVSGRRRLRIRAHTLDVELVGEQTRIFEWTVYYELQVVGLEGGKLTREGAARREGVPITPGFRDRPNGDDREVMSAMTSEKQCAAVTVLPD